jgi:hypothetical protein
MGPLGPATPRVLVGVSILLAIPALMILLSVALPAGASRWLTIVFGLAYTVIEALTFLGAGDLLQDRRGARDRAHDLYRLARAAMAETRRLRRAIRSSMRRCGKPAPALSPSDTPPSAACSDNSDQTSKDRR